MKHAYDEKNKKLVIKLEEEIDMNSCKILRNIVDGYILKFSPDICELNMKKVDFMDSSGLGFVSGRYNLAKMLGCTLVVTSPNESVKKILNMSALSKCIKVV